MFNFLVFVLLLIGAIADPLKIRYAKDFGKNSRILNGELANINEAPYQMVALYSRGDNVFYPVCSGAIINEKVFVTVAHCLYNTYPNQWKVRVGSSSSTNGGEIVDVDDFEFHMRFDLPTVDFDIAMFFTKNPITFNGVTISPAVLPRMGEVVADNFDVLLTGWGATDGGDSSVELLRKITIITINRELCQERYKDLNQVTMRMICAGDSVLETQHACVGDSGAPLVANDVLIGLASWGMGCDTDYFPGVFTRISTFINWINNHQPDSNNTGPSTMFSTPSTFSPYAISSSSSSLS